MPTSQTDRDAPPMHRNGRQATLGAGSSQARWQHRPALWTTQHGKMPLRELPRKHDESNGYQTYHCEDEYIRSHAPNNEEANARAE